MYRPIASTRVAGSAAVQTVLDVDSPGDGAGRGGGGGSRNEGALLFCLGGDGGGRDARARCSCVDAVTATGTARLAGEAEVGRAAAEPNI